MAATSSTALAISWPGRSSAGRAIRKGTRGPRNRLCTLALLGVASLAILVPKFGTPVILWNASPSVAIGLYRLTSRPSQTAALAVIRLPEPLRSLAEARGYLRTGALLIKPVAAGAGDTVCRHGALVTINGRIAARARTLDAAGRSLPAWSGCFELGPSDMFVLSADPDSFDSRYMGIIGRVHVMGFALPIWVRQAAPASAPAAS
jgi:conjugative transfer signal peptidase TraF